MSKVINFAGLFFLLLSSTAWSMADRACQKDKLVVEIFKSEPDFPMPEAILVTATAIEKCENGRECCVQMAGQIGQVFVKAREAGIPRSVEIDISKLKKCLFITKIEFQCSSSSGFGFHLSNSGPYIHGGTYSVLGEDVNIVIKKARQAF